MTWKGYNTPLRTVKRVLPTPKFRPGDLVSSHISADPFMPGVGEVVQVWYEATGYNYWIDGPDKAKYQYHEKDIYAYEPY